MARLFGRVCSVIVDGVKVDGLRCVFRVSKSLTKDPNTLDLKIYNLSERTRAGMKSKGAPVIVSAGYAENAGVIFSGDTRTIDHGRDGADWVTHVQCGDGERAYQFARFTESFAPGTAVTDVIMAAAKKTGLNLGNLVATMNTGDRGLSHFKHGYAAHGRACAELDKLLASVGLTWSIQDGAIQVLKGGAPAQGFATLLSPETGMIGSPDHGTPDKKGKPSVLKVKTLLQPQIRCGGRVEVRSSGVKGQFRVEKVEHTGDTDGGDWYTSIEAKAAT